jgi:HIRAN domain
MNTLFLAWQDPISRSWFPIGKLTYDDQRYHFGYIHGALLAQQQANFRPLLAFPNLNQSYSSIELFSPFANRLLNRSRPEYPEFIDWLNLTSESHGDPYSIDPITLLGRSGGKRVTDHFEVFPFPKLSTAGEYEIYFFTHGLRHFPTHSQQRATECTVGEELLLVHDMQNQHDASALMLQTFDRHTLGFCPRYLAKDFFKLVCTTPQAIKVVVEKVNPAPVPLQFRLLCKLTAQYEQGFQPFSSAEYQLIMPSKQSSHENLQPINRAAITASVF